MQIVKQTIIYLFSFAALLLLVTVVINSPAFDETLLPEVAAIKNIQAEPFNQNNAYPALLAINGPPGKTLKQTTEEIRDYLNQKIQTTGIDYLTDEEYDKLLGQGDDKSWQNTYNSCNSRTDKNCMKKLHAELKQQPISDARLIEQLVRYNQFIQYPEFKEATQLDFDSPLAPFGSLMKLKRLYLANALVNEPFEIYTTKTGKDLEFWRMILSNSHFLLTKMVAVATISDDVNSLSAAIKQGQLSVEQLDSLQNTLNVLNAAEIDLSRVFEFELKTGMKWFTAAETEDAFNGLFFQPQATLNFNYLQTTKPLKKVSALNTTEFYQYLKSELKNEDFAPPTALSPSMLYNYVGKVLVGYATPAYTDYIGRVHDLNGLFYLLKLQIEIALQPDSPVQQVINQSKYTNPYTLEPMSFNQDTHSIYFECMDKTSSCELDL